MPDKELDSLLNKLSSGKSSIASNEASRNLNSQQFSSVNPVEAFDFEQEVRNQKAKKDQDLVDAGLKEEDINKQARVSEYWNSILNSATSALNTVLDPFSKQDDKLLAESTAKSTDQIKDEVLGAYNQNKRFDKALLNGVVRNDDFGNLESLDENLPLMEKDDVLDNIKYGLGIEQNVLGDRKLKLNFNPNSQYFFYLDKDAEGNDILAKTKIENYDKIVKTGKSVLNAYGAVPFQKGFFREVGAGLANTYSGLAKNLVNFNRGVSNVYAALPGTGDLAKEYAENSTEFGKRFNTNVTIDQTKPGVGGTAEWLGGGIGQGAASLAQMAIMGTAGRLLGSAIAPAASQTAKFDTLVNFGAGAILNYNEAYESALNSGLSEAKAGSVGLLTGAINGLIESAVGTNRLVNWLGGGGDKVLARSVLNELGGDVSEAAISKVFNNFKKGLSGNAGKFMNDLFENKYLGSAAEEGLEELFQTFSQRGVENLYDLSIGSSEKEGEGKFGTKFFSKDTIKEGLEAALFGAILGAGGDISKVGLDKIRGKKHYSDDSIIPAIADGKRNEVEAITKTLHNGKVISDQQLDFYLERINQLDNIYKQNTGLFDTLNTLPDTNKSQQVKSEALGIINNTFDLNKKNEDLSKKLSEIQSNPDLSSEEKATRAKEISKDIRNNQLNIKFYNDYLTENYNPKEDGTVQAYEENYLNQGDIINNKFNRFVINEDTKEVDRLINNASTRIESLEEQLQSPENITIESPKEVRERLNREKLALSVWESSKSRNNSAIQDLISEYNNITSTEYQSKLREGIAQEEAIQAAEDAEVNTTTPVEAVPEIQNENNTITQEDDTQSPVFTKEYLQGEINNVTQALENPADLDQQTIDSLTQRLDDLNFDLQQLDLQGSQVQKDYDDYLAQTANKVKAVQSLSSDISEPALSALKKDMEQVVPGFNSNGINIDALRDLHAQVSQRLLAIREEEKTKVQEAANLEQETKEAKANDNIQLVTNVSFFDRLQRLRFMETNPQYYTDAEVRDIFHNTPISQILANVELVAQNPADLGYVAGQKVSQFNSTTSYLIPSMIVSLEYQGKKLGNINQIDGVEQTDSVNFNLTSEGYNKTVARNAKINALLKERGRLNPQDLTTLGFNLNWNGDFTFDPETPRTLIKDFLAAKLPANNGKPYIYDQVRQLEITEGTRDMREDENVPSIPKELEDRYVVLVQANNGKYYWVGAQNQVLSEQKQNQLYKYLFDSVTKLKAITDPDTMKEEVSKINRYLSDNIFVSILYAQLQITTPNATNKGYTLALKIKGQKGKRVALDASTYGTISDLIDQLGLNRTNLRTTVADAISAKDAVSRLSINVVPSVIVNPALQNQITFKIDDAKLNDFVVNNPTTEQVTESQGNIIDSDNPFADYIVSEMDIDPTINLIEDDIEYPEETSIEEETIIVPIEDLSKFDPSYNELSNQLKQQISNEVQPLLENYNDLNKLQKRGREVKIREIINRHKPATGDPVFSIGTSEEIMDYPQAIQWINDNLPSTISVEDLNRLLGNIKNNGTTFGAFSDNIIYLNTTAEAGTQYHEAFHAVFRMLISDKQIQSAYNIAAQKYGKATSADISNLKASSSVYSNYIDNQLADLWLEEKMANDFKTYANSANTNKSGLNSIWNKITEWFRFITGKMDELQSLFYNINRGKFKNATIQSNIFSSYANQERVFSIFTKGTDATSNTITTTQLEGQGIVASLTNKLLQSKINKLHPGLSDNAILDILIAEKAKFYSIDENPYYAQYLEDKGLMNDDIFIDAMSRNLELKRNVFTLPTNIAALKKDVRAKSQIFDIDEARTIEEDQENIDDIGEVFDKDVWTIGGETSFSKVLREYISLVTVKTNDEYGQDIEEAVDFKKVYRGLVRALGGIEEVSVLPRFKALAEFDTDINAVFNQLLNDLGLTLEGGINTQDITKNYDLWRKFVTAFNNEKVAWYTILHSNEQSRLIESNNASAKDVQFNEWLQNYSITIEETAFDENLKKAINSTVDFINRSENINVDTFNEAKLRSNEIKNAFSKVSIKLSNAYITYSLLKKAPYDSLDQEGRDFVDSFLGVEGLYDAGNIPFIVSEFKSGYNPFLTSKDDKGRERGAATRIKSIAEQNALFDPTVGENSFQNADGKNVYSIIRPSFGLVKLRWLVDPVERQRVLEQEKTKKDDFINPLENKQLNHLLADENVDLIMKGLTPSMIDGYRQTTIEGDVNKVEEGEGVTFGKFNAQQYLLSDMLMFLSNRKSLNRADETGKAKRVGQAALFNINQMEASNTGYGVFLPVNDFKTINSKATDILFDYLAQEAIRIHKVKTQFGKPETTVWKGYNDKQGARGFKLMEFSGYELDQYIDDITNDPNNKTAEDIYATLLYEEDKIKQLIKLKLESDIASFKLALQSNDVISKLPNIELIKQGYLKDKEELKADKADKLITDFYLNAYINTLGINNLLLDNYAKKVKNTVDWFKRAKGIIGSGPDMGEGFTKVAVYKEPTKFIETTNLTEFDIQAFQEVKRTELEAEGVLNTQEIEDAIKVFTKDLNLGKIDIADAQSYVTLDHKILQLQRWGRFPTQVANIYNKIMNGQHITWNEKNILEKNNSALNSTKTVAYNGDFYFKLSELILSPNLVGAKDKEGNTIMGVIKDINGNDVPFPSKPLEGFEYLYNKYKAMIIQGVDQALPESASKMATIAPAEFAEDGKFDFTKSIMDLENKFKRLQVETPSGKSKIIHGTQLIQLIHSEQDDNLAIDFQYNDDIKTLGQLRDYYRQLLADNRLDGFREAIAYMRDPISGEFNSKALTKKFYDTIIASGSDEVLSNFFTPDHNGERQFNWNLGPIVNKAEQLFLAHFSKGVLSQKVPGLKVSLVSDTGIFIKDKETGKMRSLEHMKLDADGNYYSECLLPAFANELLGKDPSDERFQEVLKMFGVRIPTQDKHSMMSLKVVGFLPVEYGSVGVFPKQIVFLSGADFDIDSEFIHRADFYTDENGTPILYGTAKTDIEKYREYKKWNMSNNKLLKTKFKDLGFSYTKATVDETMSVFKALNMPSTLAEFIEQKPINRGVNNNGLLKAQIKFLTNDYVRSRAATIPASMDSIKDVAKDVERILGLDQNLTVSPNTPIARFNANRSNMEGKSGIAPVAIANVTHALLSTYNVELLNGMILPTISGRKATGFSGINTINSDTNRKNDNISTLLSAMTDNAKEQLAKLLNLTFNGATTDTLPTVAYMLSIGYTMEEAILFMNQPTIRHYVSGDIRLGIKLDDLQRKLDKEIQLNTGFDPNSSNLSPEQFDKIQRYKDTHKKTLSVQVLQDSLNENDLEPTDLLHLNEVSEYFNALQTQAKYTSNVSKLLSLNKGMKSTFDQNFRLEKVLKDLQLDFINDYITSDIDTYDQLINKLVDKKVVKHKTESNTKFVTDINIPVFKIGDDINATPFDARLALLSDPNTIQNIIIYKKVLDTSKEFFLLNTNVFRTMNGLTTLGLKELIPHFMDKSYKTYLEEVFPEKYDNLMIAHQNAGYMIHKSGDNSVGRDLYNLKKDPNFRNNLLIKLLTLKEPARGSSIVRIEFPTRIKAEGDFYTNLNNAFKELFMNNQTREFARKLYYYSYFKDGLQFKNKSFINTIPSWVFKDVSTALDLLNDDFKNDDYSDYSSLKGGLITTVHDMLTSFARIESLAKKLPTMKRNSRAIFGQIENADKSRTTAFKNIQGIDFTSLDAYQKSMKELIKNTPKNALKEDLIDLYKVGGSLAYDIASHTESQEEIGLELVDVVTSKLLKSIKGFDASGVPITMTAEEVVKYYMDNGSLPIAFEVTTDIVKPIKENGLNSSIIDNQFIDSMSNIKKAIPKETVTPNNYTAQEILENDYVDLDNEEEIVEDTSLNLDNSENNSTFVNPFQDFDVTYSDGPSDIDFDDNDFTIFEEYQNGIDQSISDEQMLNDLDNDVEEYRDADDNPIC